MELVLVILALAGGILIGIAVGWRAGREWTLHEEWWRKIDPSDSAGA